MGKLKAKVQEEDEIAAEMFRALGDATRLRIFNLLRSRAAMEATLATLEGADSTMTQLQDTPPVQESEALAEEGIPSAPAKSGKSGKNDKVPPVGSVPVGEICLHVTGEKKFTSAISHHLKEMRHVGLISVERCGKQKLCRINDEAVQELGAYLVPRPEQGTLAATVVEVPFK